MTLSLFAALFFSAEIVSADALSAAQRELEAVMETCYPDIDAESLIVPEISIDGVFSTISIGLNGKTMKWSQYFGQFSSVSKVYRV